MGSSLGAWPLRDFCVVGAFGAPCSDTTRGRCTVVCWVLGRVHTPPLGIPITPGGVSHGINTVYTL